MVDIVPVVSLESSDPHLQESGKLPDHQTAFSFLKTQRHISPVRFRPYYECVCAQRSAVILMMRSSIMTLLLLISILAANLRVEQHALWVILRFDIETRFFLCCAKSVVDLLCEYTMRVYYARRRETARRILVTRGRLLTLTSWPVQKPVPLSNQSLSFNS